MIEFGDMELFNFQSVRHAVVPLAGQGLVLVTGRNGSGKSSIFLDGIAYILYGISLRYKAAGALYGESPGNAVVNRHGKGGMFGKLSILINGVKYTVVRARGHKKYEDGLTLLGDQDLSLGRTADTQALLTKLLGMGPKAFCRSVIFAADLMQFPMLPNSRKMEVMNELLDLLALDDGLAATKAVISSLQQQKDTLERQAEAKEQVMSQLADDLTEQTAHAKQFEAQARNAARARAAEIAEIQKLVTECEADLKKQQAIKDKLDQEAAKIVKYVDQAAVIVEEEKAAVGAEDDEWSEQAADLRAKIKQRNDWLKSIDGLDDGDCPTCHTNVSAAHLAAERVKCKAELDGLADQLAKVDAELNALDDRRKEVEQADARLNQKTARLRQINGELRQVLHEVSELEVDISSGKARIEEKQASKPSSENPHVAAVAKVRSRIADAERGLHEIRAAIVQVDEKLADEKTLLECFGPKGCRLQMLDRTIPFLNHEAARVQAIMSSPISVKFRIRGEGESYAGTLDIDVTNPKGAAAYDGDSSGERRKVDVIILLCLLALVGSRGNKSVAQSCFDESFECLDAPAREAVVRVIRDISIGKSSVFVLSHSPDVLGSLADQVWTVKDGGELLMDAA